MPSKVRPLSSAFTLVFRGSPGVPYTFSMQMFYLNTLLDFSDYIIDHLLFCFKRTEHICPFLTYLISTIT